MKRTITFLLLIAPLLSLNARAQSSSPSLQDERKVRDAVYLYIQGLKSNDVTFLKRAFSPEAKLFFVGQDGKLGQLTQEDWYKTFAASAGKEEQGDLRIENVEITRDIAAAKVVEDYPKSRYTDYLSLVKIEGRWLIVNKVYTAEKR